MRFWFIASKSGDFRLAADGPHSRLNIENPTPRELVQLEGFLSGARERRWVDAPAEELLRTFREATPIPVPEKRDPTPYEGIAPEDAPTDKMRVVHPGTITLPIRAGVIDAGKLLAAGVAVDGKKWTAVRSIGGVVTLENPEVVNPATSVAAVTIPKPARGCPVPEAASRRASQVLRAFCTERQWQQFQVEGFLVAIGVHSGRVYHVFHRDEAARRRLRRSLVQLGRGPVCAWNNAVPPEEEALSLKLAVEHQERWLLERAIFNGQAQVWQ